MVRLMIRSLCLTAKLKQCLYHLKALEKATCLLPAFFFSVSLCRVLDFFSSPGSFFLPVIDLSLFVTTFFPVSELQTSEIRLRQLRFVMLLTGFFFPVCWQCSWDLSIYWSLSIFSLSFGSIMLYSSRFFMFFISTRFWNGLLLLFYISSLGSTNN